MKMKCDKCKKRTEFEYVTDDAAQNFKEIWQCTSCNSQELLTRSQSLTIQDIEKGEDFHIEMNEQTKLVYDYLSTLTEVKEAIESDPKIHIEALASKLEGVVDDELGVMSVIPGLKEDLILHVLSNCDYSKIAQQLKKDRGTFSRDNGDDIYF